jgi:MarR family transcriptional regulator, organic hydroperoxide resistance regulator
LPIAVTPEYPGGVVEQPDAADANAELFELLLELKRRLSEHAEQRLRGYEIASKDNWALQALDEPMPMNVLAEHMGTDASYLTGIADRLEQRGLVERQPHPTDRRIKHLALTTDGRRLRQELRQLLWSDVPALERLTPDEREQLRRLLSRALGHPR